MPPFKAQTGRSSLKPPRYRVGGESVREFLVTVHLEPIEESEKDVPDIDVDEIGQYHTELSRIILTLTNAIRFCQFWPRGRRNCTTPRPGQTMPNDCAITRR